MDIELDGLALSGLGRVNVLLGRNGSGKSRALRLVDERRDSLVPTQVRYIAPERAGALEANPNHEGDLNRMGNAWMADNGRVNQYALFKQQSVVLLKRLEIATLREMETRSRASGEVQPGFQEEFELINSLLERVRLERRETAGLPFTVVDRATNTDQITSALSSGEAELVSLAIEVLHFRSVCAGGPGLLLVDEPDVHLHPDLQQRLATFVITALADTQIDILVATHSTALVAGLATSKPVQVCYMKRGATDLVFRSVTDIDRTILPIFGAHPLSSLFTTTPLLLVEGTDEERIWTQAARSSNGTIRFQVREVGGKGNFPAYEREVDALLEAVYDDAVGYSLRDRDDDPEGIQDVGRIVRCRLGCRASENLMLADETLARAGCDWVDLVGAIDAWLVGNPTHQAHGSMTSFRDKGYDRKGFDLKRVRNVLAGLMGDRPWEVSVGQAIAAWRTLDENERSTAPGSLYDFLGRCCQSNVARRACAEFLPCLAAQRQTNDIDPGERPSGSAALTARQA